MVSEAMVGGPTTLKSVAKQYIMLRERQWSKAVYLMVAEKQKKGLESQNPPQGHTSRDPTSFC